MATNGTKKSIGGRQVAGRQTKSAEVVKAGAKPARKPSWRKVLEHYLVLEGYSREEAKELVAISAK